MASFISTFSSSNIEGGGSGRKKLKPYSCLKPLQKLFEASPVFIDKSIGLVFGGSYFHFLSNIFLLIKLYILGMKLPSLDIHRTTGNISSVDSL